jgi:hypothetical protein
VQPQFRVSEKAFKKAQKDATYLRVGKGNKAPPTRSISAAQKHWENDPEERDIIFIPQLRLSGTPSDIRRTLSSWYSPMTSEMAEAYINNAITYQNFKTSKAADFQNELALKESASNREKAESRHSYLLASWFVQEIKAGRATPSAEAKKGAKSPKRKSSGGRKGSRGASIKQKFDDIIAARSSDPTGKLANRIVHYHHKTGKSSTVDAPSEDGRSKKYFNRSIPLMADNEADYRKILAEVGYTPDVINQEVALANNNIKTRSMSKTKSPRASHTFVLPTQFQAPTGPTQFMGVGGVAQPM